MYKEKQILADRLKAAGVDQPDLCIERALAIGYTLERIADVIDYFHKRQGTGWGGGALFGRLTRSTPDIELDRGWPKPDPQAAAEQRKAAQERTRSEVRDDKQQRLAERSAMEALKESLEAKHGAALDRLLETDQWAAWELIGKGTWFEVNREFVELSDGRKSYRLAMLQALDAKGGPL